MKLDDIALRERKHAETKVGLLELSKEKLKEKPFEDISVRELCSGMLISDVTFFNYFPNKNDLLVYYIQMWSLEVDYHTHTHFSRKSGLDQIGYIFENAAEVIKEIPNLMTEIIAFTTRNFTSIRFIRISDAEKMVAFPDTPGIEKYDPVQLNDLFSRRIKKAIREKDLPADTDMESLTFSLVSIFFGTPIGWTRLDPGRVKIMYKHHLDILWKGLKNSDVIHKCKGVKT